VENIVTNMTSAGQGFSIHVPANTLWTVLQLIATLHNNSDNRRSVYYIVRTMSSARQRSCKHSSLIEKLSFLCGSCPSCLFVASLD
jgi:hypothetical protein